MVSLRINNGESYLINVPSLYFFHSLPGSARDSAIPKNFRDLPLLPTAV